MSLSSKQFETLALAELDTLYRMARRLTHDVGRADDLVQETFVRALRSREGFNLQEYGIKPWLLRIMFNLHLNRAEREKHQPTAVPEQALQAAAGFTDPVGFPIDLTNFQAMDQQLVHALEDLPEDYRAVLLLWAVEDFSYKEIATTLEIPIGTVMSRLHRARQRLIQQLRPYAIQEGLVRE